MGEVSWASPNRRGGSGAGELASGTRDGAANRADSASVAALHGGPDERGVCVRLLHRAGTGRTVERCKQSGAKAWCKKTGAKAQSGGGSDKGDYAEKNRDEEKASGRKTVGGLFEEKGEWQ